MPALLFTRRVAAIVFRHYFCAVHTYFKLIYYEPLRGEHEDITCLISSIQGKTREDLPC